MTPDSTRRYHELLARLIEHVLRCPSGPIRIPELAAFTGFSRFHLARLFREITEETLDHFLRRIRLERAAHALLNSGASVLEIAGESGYQSPEAFSRAFRAAYGVLPTEYRRTSRDWKLVSPSDLHWNCHWATEDLPEIIDSQVVLQPTQAVAVWRIVGSYSRLANGWQRLEEEFCSVIPRHARFVTLYLDNMWTHPTSATLRADIGWILDADAPAPTGMRRRVIAAGRYATTSRFLERAERNEGWSSMCGRWSVALPQRRLLSSYDEYAAWPLPFESVLTRIHIGLPFE